jgi:leucyl aminopeptidase
LRFDVVPSDLHSLADVDTLLVFAQRDGTLSPWGAEVDRALGGLLGEALRRGALRGDIGEAAVLPTSGRVPAARVVLAGLGAVEQRDRHRLGLAAAHGARAAVRAGARHLVSEVPDLPGFPRATAAEVTLLGLARGGYRFGRYRTQEAIEPLARVGLVGRDDEIGGAVASAAAIAEGLHLARDLVNLPPNHKPPEVLAERITEAGKAFGFAVEILHQADLAALGAGGILAVGQGSAHPPCAVFLRYDGGQGPHLGYLGKGMTFDSGGLSLKPAEGMETMKSDMAGAAAVVGAVAAIARRRLPVRVTGLVMLAENMPSGHAQRPGDILTLLSGKTVEMLNSDAEGRLILADGVTLLEREGVEAIVDLATLTGAVVVALGGVRAGLLGNDEALLAAVEAAAARSGDRVWRLPADDDYRELLKSHIADLRNTGSRRGAGVQVGGLFIGAQVERTPWAHLDIAGVAFQEDDRPPLGFGGTGFGVELLTRLAEDRARSAGESGTA